MFLLIDLLWKSVDWFLCDQNIGRKRIKDLAVKRFPIVFIWFLKTVKAN